MSQLVSSSISQRDTWTVQSISVFALPSVTHNSQSLLSCPILETSATALCGTTGIIYKYVYIYKYKYVYIYIYINIIYTNHHAIFLEQLKFRHFPGCSWRPRSYGTQELRNSRDDHSNQRYREKKHWYIPKGHQRTMGI